MSSPDNPGEKNDPKKTPNTDKPETSATDKKDAPASSAAASDVKETASKKKDDAAKAGSASARSGKKPDLSAKKAPGDEQAETAAEPPRRSKRLAIAIAAGLAIILLGGPALFAFCVAQSTPSFDAAIAPNGNPVACPVIAGHFDDCYLSEEVTVSAPAAAPKSGLEAFCCDVVVERSLILKAEYTGASGSLPRTLNADGNSLPINDGARITGNPVLLSGTTPPQRSLRLSAMPQFSVPLLEQAESFLGRPTGIPVERLIASIAPGSVEETVIQKDVPLTEGGTMVRISTGAPELQQISIRARTSGTLLFTDTLSSGTNPAEILVAPSGLQRTNDGWLMRRIASAGPSGGSGIRAAYDILQRQSVSRLTTSDEAPDALHAAGRACVAFYSAMREDFSRFDAAVATYVAARPSGLLTALSPADPHGCTDDGNSGRSSELAADWLALDAPMVELVMAPANETKASADETGQEIVRKLLLDFASAAKSGARLQDIKAAINDPVAIRFGRSGETAPGSRDSVLRMLHQQWAHVGCWIYAPSNGAGGMAMMLAEAQYPYLNRIVLGFDAGGLVEKVEVTGVTFDDILRFKAANRGRGCQEFLNPIRLADYRDWYADNPAGTATPSDHAERLFHEGLKRKFRLN
ncbi:hypothetical protein [Nisaea nitritireducens]|uniref:hypothetical protein n=1 Tax=Nisaea nitritireducens TaxID=568392 RepID=UPI0018692105|nr:hypothetical protein [Nisaea nitritireducens]